MRENIVFKLNLLGQMTQQDPLTNDSTREPINKLNQTH